MKQRGWALKATQHRCRVSAIIRTLTVFVPLAGFRPALGCVPVRGGAEGDVAIKIHNTDQSSNKSAKPLQMHSPECWSHFCRQRQSVVFGKMRSLVNQCPVNKERATWLCPDTCQVMCPLAGDAFTGLAPAAVSVLEPSLDFHVPQRSSF